MVEFQTVVANVNDIRMYYEIQGNGEPLVLLHGGMGSGHNWEKQCAALSKNYKVIVPDSRGHGRTTFSTRPITYALLASDVVALLDHLKIRKANILGWSDGGIIGLILAIHHSDRLIKVIAYGANYDPSGLRPGAEENPKVKEHIERAATDYQRLSPQPERFGTFIENISNMWTTEPKLTAKQLGKIKVPVMVLDGENEEAILPQHTKKMAGMIPGSRLVLMKGTGHFAPIEKPEEFNKIVLEFLAQ